MTHTTLFMNKYSISPIARDVIYMFYRWWNNVFLCDTEYGILVVAGFDKVTSYVIISYDTATIFVKIISSL